MVEVLANSRDHDKTPRSEASNLGLLCLPITLFPDYNGLTLGVLSKISYVCRLLNKHRDW